MLVFLMLVIPYCHDDELLVPSSSSNYVIKLLNPTEVGSSIHCRIKKFNMTLTDIIHGQ